MTPRWTIPDTKRGLLPSKRFLPLELPLPEAKADQIQPLGLALDQFLSIIPDQPKVPGLFPEASDNRGLQSNAVIDWIRHLDLQGWTPTPVSSSERTAGAPRWRGS